MQTLSLAQALKQKTATKPFRHTLPNCFYYNVPTSEGMNYEESSVGISYTDSFSGTDFQKG